MNQKYKVGLLHAMNLGLKVYKEKMGKSFNILSLINTVDYCQSVDENTAKFDVELSYTILDWQIAEQVIKNPLFLLEDVEEEQRAQLCFDVWPRGWGLLHMLTTVGIGESEKSSSQKDFTRVIYNVQNMFDICKNS